jgi:flagellar P-ring protein precursor FlgI
MNRRTLAGLAILLMVMTGVAQGQTRIKDITRLKGEREHKVVGLGLVVGLPGTGDGADFRPAIDALTNILIKFRGFYTDPSLLPRLKKAGNVAIVEVTVTFPAYHRTGDKIDGSVSSIGSAKSLKGGILLPTPLQGSRLSDDTVYAVAEGPVSIAGTPTTAIVRSGATIEKAVESSVIEDNTFTLILRGEKADLTNASMIAARINSECRKERTLLESSGKTLDEPATDAATILGADAVRVVIPAYHRDQPVDFIGAMERLEIGRPDSDARVIVDERTKSVVAGLDVRISPVLTMHGNIALVVEEGDGSRDLTLKDVLDALRKVEGTSDDMIAIVKMLDEAGALHGKLEFK